MYTNFGPQGGRHAEMWVAVPEETGGGDHGVGVERGGGLAAGQADRSFIARPGQDCRTVIS